MMIMRIGMGTVETLEIIYTSFLLVISCLLMLKLSGKIFKVTILMYGKRNLYQRNLQMDNNIIYSHNK